MQKARGFTLIELMVTVAIAALLLAIGVPSFVRTIKSNTMSTAVNAFMGDMRFARSEAVRRGGRVVMCKSDDPENAAPACATAAGAKGWATGWLVFHDLDGDGLWSSGDTTLRVQAPLSSIDAAMEGTAGAATRFQFTATGRLSAVASSAKVTFGATDFSTELQRVICVSAGGRARIAGDGAATCGSDNQ